VVSAALNSLHIDSFRLLLFWDSDPVHEVVGTLNPLNWNRFISSFISVMLS